MTPEQINLLITLVLTFNTIVLVYIKKKIVIETVNTIINKV